MSRSLTDPLPHLPLSPLVCQGLALSLDQPAWWKQQRSARGHIPWCTTLDYGDTLSIIQCECWIWQMIKLMTESGCILFNWCWLITIELHYRIDWIPLEWHLYIFSYICVIWIHITGHFALLICKLHPYTCYDYNSDNGNKRLITCTILIATFQDIWFLHLGVLIIWAASTTHIWIWTAGYVSDSKVGTIYIFIYILTKNLDSWSIY